MFLLELVKQKSRIILHAFYFFSNFCSFFADSHRFHSAFVIDTNGKESRQLLACAWFSTIEKFLTAFFSGPSGHYCYGYVLHKILRIAIAGDEALCARLVVIQNRSILSVMTSYQSPIFSIELFFSKCNIYLFFPIV